MERRKVLPQFELGGFVKDVGRVGEQARRREIEGGKRRMRELKEELKVSDRKFEEATDLRKERRAAEKRQLEREERNDMWTTPGLRPLAEAPILDWEQFVRWYIPSDLRYEALVPKDHHMRCRAKDVDGESSCSSIEFTGSSWLMIQKGTVHGNCSMSTCGKT